MFDLETSHLVLLIVCLFAACCFEFVNGFHDTANAVATVIYTHSLKPWQAVIWSGAFNFLGVFAGGIGVAIGIINLLPVETLVDQNTSHSLSMVASLLLTAIFWNVLTWYLGLPSSSSHALVGSILGVGVAYSLMSDSSTAVNWKQAEEIGLSLLFSPIAGFSLAIIAMYLIRRLTKNTNYRDSLFKEPKKDAPPPVWIRLILILTCTFVSFFHGSNDGQKGIGLVMLILIGIVPAHFALNDSYSPSSVPTTLYRIEKVINELDTTVLAAPDRAIVLQAKTSTTELVQIFASLKSMSEIPQDKRFIVRKQIVLLDRDVKVLMTKSELKMSELDRTVLRRSLIELRKAIDYSPKWVLIMISVSLGLGTMIGWKRIVKTIGEKIGKEHLTYAQGASAEFVTAATIGVSSHLGLPASTTHILSSGIAGSMVANRGVKNLESSTVRNILLAWVLTLPVVMTMSASLFLLFRSLFTGST
ncbi:MAG: inorganic phosphate transporter [Cyclobacteriaceae bacterium]|nr:inorganic phosphate transporter [Cyclobacteriaceae bacterium]